MTEMNAATNGPEPGGDCKFERVRVKEQVLCIDDANPVPGTQGWHITKGRVYRAVMRFGYEHHAQWVTIIADNGQPGNYRAGRFRLVKDGGDPVPAPLPAPAPTGEENAVAS